LRTHQSGPCKIMCDRCGLLFKSAANYKKHVSMRKFPCGVYECCGMKFIKREEVYWHCKKCGADYDKVMQQTPHERLGK
jgi:hypothetical protein